MGGMNRYINLFTLLLIIGLLPLSFNVAGQDKTLADLSERLNQKYISDSLDVHNYLKKNGLPKRFSDPAGTVVELIRIHNGMPLYYYEHNAGAAITTGANLLHEGGVSGLNLAGGNMLVGVWDSGYASDHNEFEDRVLLGDGGGSATDHATHVMGTILAAGLNASAKGMAYKANGRSFGWDNDLAEVTNFAASGGLLSNHSYSLLSGWNGGVWYGDAGISELEDYKFGFYGFDAPLIDEIAFNAPYYLMIKSAGNDRGDSGDARYPADGNQGSGFDSIGPAASAKNNLTVGAVEKLSDYTSPQSVVMSSFSSWGPTDDGRIKPDIVGAGVGVFSTSSSGPDEYSVKNGTSMAAPNVTGSLTLLQEYYSKLNAGEFMRSSTLKGLIIHTAKEAGAFDGPDYRFGWGVLDVAAAANHLTNLDQENFVLTEETLTNGQEYTMDIYPAKDSKVTATICWIDPAGSSPSISLDPEDLMLVNDLDIRIVDDAGKEFEPWILNPASPAQAAKKGDNFRDNVERVEFVVPTERKYTIKVNHKNSLRGGVQNFSLVLTQNSIYDGKISYYYIGEDGDWYNPDNWSLQSGGESAGIVPSSTSNVVIDENSFQTSNGIILSSNVSINSLSWLANQNTALDLNQNRLELSGSIILDKKQINPIVNGTIALTPNDDGVHSIYAGASIFDDLELEINSSLDQIQFFDSLYISSLNIMQGNVEVNTDYLGVGSIVLAGDESSQFNITGAALLEVGTSFKIQSNINLVSDELSTIRFNNQGLSELSTTSSNTFNGLVSISGGGAVDISGDFSINLLEVDSSEALIENSLLANNFNVVNDATVSIAAGSTITVNEFFNISSGIEKSTLKSTTAEKAFLVLTKRTKYCYDAIEIVNVDLLGEAVASVGFSSTLTNSANWLEVSCNDILFAEFDFADVCAGGLTTFSDLSSGVVENVLWEVYENEILAYSSNDTTLYYSFATSGSYEVKLTASNSTQTNSVAKEINIIDNHLEPNEVIDNSTSLASLKSAANYQWFVNNKPVEGASDRIYTLPEELTGDLLFYVVTSDEQCNMKSSDLVKIITSVSEGQPFENLVSIYPNPTSGSLTISSDRLEGPFEVTVVGADGRIVYSKRIRFENNGVHKLELEDVNKGIYVLSLMNNERRIFWRIVIDK
jgi:hypothetical protein